MTDADLLHSLVQARSHEAFAQIVARYLGLVYSAAYRQVGAGGLAEEVTQAVFLLLWQRPGAVRGGAALAGWLVNAARLAALAARRQESRLKHREQQVAAMNPQSTTPDRNAGEIAHLLDDALAHLSEADRSAIALRYLQGQPLAEVAAVLGISESAANMRVQRALGRLRRHFLKAGISLPAAGLASVLVTQVVKPPAALAQAVTAIPQAGAPLSVVSIANCAWTSMALLKLKLAGALIAAALVLLMGTVVVHYALKGDGRTTLPAPSFVSDPAQKPAPAATSLPSSQDAPWRPRFSELYRLDPRQAIKFIPTPYIPERESYWNARLREIATARGTSQPTATRAPSAMLFMLKDTDEVQTSGGLFIPSLRPGLAGLLNDLHLATTPSPLLQPEIGPQFANITLRGDWIVRDDTRGRWLVRDTTAPDAIWRGLEQILKEQTGRSIRFVKRPVDRQCVVARGRFALKPVDGQPGDGIIRVRVSSHTALPAEVRETDIKSLLDVLAHWNACSIADETESSSTRVRWKLEASATGAPATDGSAPLLEQLLADVARQTSLKFSKEMRSVEVLTAIEE